MDSNGTRYHLLYGQVDWGACLPEPQGSKPLLDIWSQVEERTEKDQSPLWDYGRCEVMLPARIFQFQRSPGDKSPHLSKRRGAAGDVYGNLYWISDDEHAIMVRSVGSGRPSIFWHSAAIETKTATKGGFIQVNPSSSTPLQLSGLTVTYEHYLVVGILEPPGLLVFDLHGGGEPMCIDWPAPPEGEPPFIPFDLAAQRDGGLWILDRALENPTVARLWSLDRLLNVLDLQPPNMKQAVANPDFTPIHSPLEPEKKPMYLPMDEGFFDSAVIVRAGDPVMVGGLVAIETLTDCSALLLDNASGGRYARLLRFDTAGQAFPQTLSLQVLEEHVENDLRPTFSLLGYDFTFLPATDSISAGPQPCCGQGAEVAPGTGENDIAWGSLVVVDQEGNQAYAFALIPKDMQPGESLSELMLQSEPRYLPMRLFGGRGLVTCSQNGQLRAFYDSGRNADNWIPLAEQMRPRYTYYVDLYTPLSTRSAADSRLRSAFDSGLPDCRWHRLILDACLPPGTRLQVWSRAADNETDLALCPWQPEPSPYRRSDGCELPYLLDQHEVDSDSGTWELLFQNARGRFLQVQLRLHGDGRNTPRLRALRAYYPRFSYLEQYLPGVYRQEPISASFLDRYLANPEGLWTSIEDRIALAQALFDERTCPAEYLDWLASWFGTVFDAGWDEVRKRLFLAHAAELYSQRGTALGLVRMVRLATDCCPSERIFSESLEPADGGWLSPVRLVETFRTRQVPAVVFGDPTSGETPSFDLPQEKNTWAPVQGASQLHALYQNYLRDLYENSLLNLQQAWGMQVSSFGLVSFPVLPPENQAAARDRVEFLHLTLPFPYADPLESDLSTWRDFLARRYDYIEALNSAYRLPPSVQFATFESIPFPTELPFGGKPLSDWIEYVSIVLPTRRSAHHFTVLIPTASAAQNTDASQMIERVRRIVNLEKPAHTTFTIKEYWALFRVGEARLGFDTQIDSGSRLSPLVLDASYLAQNTLSFSHPWSVANRVILGRDRLGPSRCSQV